MAQTRDRENRKVPFIDKGFLNLGKAGNHHIVLEGWIEKMPVRHGAGLAEWTVENPLFIQLIEATKSLSGLGIDLIYWFIILGIKMN